MTYSKTRYPEAIMTFACHRIKDLLHTSILQTEPIERIVRSAYLQGMVDAIEVLSPSDEEKELVQG